MAPQAVRLNDGGWFELLIAGAISPTRSLRIHSVWGANRMLGRRQVTESRMGWLLTQMHWLLTRLLTAGSEQKQRSPQIPSYVSRFP